MAVGTDSILQATWPMPLWVRIVLLTVGILFVGGIYLSDRGQAGRGIRASLAVLRLTLLLLVVWMWAGWSWQRYRSDKPELLIVLDRSASMETEDIKQGATPEIAKLSRFAAVANLLSSLDARSVQQLERNYLLRWLLIDDSVETIDVPLDNVRQELTQIAVNGPQSRLGDSLSSIVAAQAGRSTAAIVMFSDGINTSGSPLSTAAAIARSAAIPVYAVATGQELAVPDVQLADLLVDDAVFLGDQVVLQVTASANDITEANLSVRLKDSSSGEVLDQQSVRLTGEHSQQQLNLVFTPKRAGELPLLIELSEVRGESNLENNLLQRTIVVQDRSLRVLLVQRAPSFEFRFLKNLLQRSRATDERAASFELHSVLQEADSEYIEQDDAAMRLVPSDAQTLSSYDVFIFGDINPELISRSAQQMIFKQVTEKGAGCVFIAGRDTAIPGLLGWPLGVLLPGQLTSFTIIAIDAPYERMQPQLWTPTLLRKTA